jgi:hypothetical protein
MSPGLRASYSARRRVAFVALVVVAFADAPAEDALRGGRVGRLIGQQVCVVPAEAEMPVFPTAATEIVAGSQDHPNAAVAATKEGQSTRGVLLSEWCC